MSLTFVAAEPKVSHGPISRLRQAASFPVLLSTLLSLLAVFTVRWRFDDPDMWWHLKVGEIVWTTRTIPTTDLFSYTTNHHAWVPHEWLSQAIIYCAYRLGGYIGLMLWLCLLTAALLLAGHILCSLYSGNAKIGFLGAMTIWFFSTAGLAIRPQIIGYLLLILELLIVQLGRVRDPRWFFCLPPLFAVWINCHGSFFLGLVVGAVFLASSFFQFQIGSLVALRWSGRKQEILALSLLLSLGALFLNPGGFNQILYPLNTIMRQPVGLSHVSEWMPLSMSSARGIGLLAVFAGVLLLVILQKSELYLDELVLLSLGAWLAVSHQRMVFVFGILAAPILSRLLSTSWEEYEQVHDRPLLNAALMALAVLAMYWAFPSRTYLVRQVEEGSPVKAVDFINAQHLSGNMLNEYVYGGYLIWAAPEHPVFVDGRADVFEWTGVLSEFGRWATLQSDPKILLDKYKISFCLLSRTSPMARVFPLLPGWSRIYSDENSIIFARTASPGL